MPSKIFTPLLSKAGSKMYRNSHIIAEITKNCNTHPKIVQMTSYLDSSQISIKQTFPVILVKFQSFDVKLSCHIDFCGYFAIIFERAAKSADASKKMLHIMQSNVIFLKGTFIVVKMRGQPLPYYLLFRFHRQISNIHYFDWFYPKKC